MKKAFNFGRVFNWTCPRLGGTILPLILGLGIDCNCYLIDEIIKLMHTPELIHLPIQDPSLNVSMLLMTRECGPYVKLNNH